MSFPPSSDYLPTHHSSLMKLAEGKKKKDSPEKRVAKAIGAGAVGMGAGMLAGAGTGMLADQLAQRTTGSKIPFRRIGKIAPLAMAGAGTAAGLWSAAHKSEVDDAFKR